jgi:CheY-like chemotaxis protein
MLKILLIEDEPLVVRMYQKALTFDGFEVLTALTGKDGIAKAKAQKPDVILLDVMMPEMNGIEVLMELKKDPTIKNIPIIMLTNLSGEQDKQLALSKGAIEFWVKKDLNPMEVGEKIKQLFANKTK